MSSKWITQKEKREVLANDRKVSTYLAHAMASAEDEMGGRYAKVQPTTVTGSSPGSAFPRMPEGNPWREEPIGKEAFIDGRGEGLTLGFEIDRPDASSTVAAVEDTPTPASSESHVITGVGDGRVPPGFRRRF